MTPSSSSLLSSADLAADEREIYGLSLETWVKFAIIIPLFVALYWLVLRWLWDKTNPIYGEANWGHAICIPFIGVYYLYVNRDEILKQPVMPLLIGKLTLKYRVFPAIGMVLVGAALWAFGHDADGLIKFAGASLAAYGVMVALFDWGIGSLLTGLGMFAYGIYPGKNQFLQGCAMILTLFGVVLMLTGWRIMKYVWFPIVYLICGIPWPPLVYSYIASPLQTLAAQVAVVALRFTGVTAYHTGTKINIAAGPLSPVRTLNVAEACAGLRSLMTFITLGAAIAFLSARPLWQKIIITLSAIPIAIFCNVMRVAGQGLLDHYVSQQLSESFAHQFVGLVMLVPAFFLILMVGWVLDHLFVEEMDAGAGPGAARSSSGVLEVPRRIAPGAKAQAAEVKESASPVQQKTIAPVNAAPPAPAKPSTAAPLKAATTAPMKQAPSAPVKQAPTAPLKPAPSAPLKQAPSAPVTPPRPGIVPPRPGIVPPRPGIVSPRPGSQQPNPVRRPPPSQEGS